MSEKGIELTQNGFGPKTGAGGFPSSRDFGDSYSCNAINCVANVSGMCISLARCVIGEDGKCVGFIKRKDKKEDTQ